MKVKLIVAALASIFVTFAVVPGVASPVNQGATEFEMQQQNPKGRKVKGKKKKSAKGKEDVEEQKGEKPSEKGQTNRRTKGK